MRRFAALGFLVTGVLLFGMTAAAGPPFPAREVSGRVVDAGGRPVAGALVELVQYGRGTVATRNSTANGGYIFPLAGSRPDPVSVRIWAKGYRLLESPWFSPRDGGRFDLIAIPVAQAVSGWVEDMWGQPVVGADVEYLTSLGALAARVTTDGSGSFAMFPDTLSDGGSLRVVAPGFRAHQQVLPVPGATAVVRLTPASQEVKGRVLSARGMGPIASARLLILTPDRGLAWEGTADSLGRFRIVLPVVEGEYRMVAWQVGHLPAVQAFTLLGDTRQVLQPLVLERATATVSGRVLDAAGRPRPKVTVHLDLRGVGTLTTTITDDRGRYAFRDVQVGRDYRVLAVYDQKPADSGWFSLKSGDDPVRDLHPPDASFAVGFGSGAITGRVVAATGLPNAGAAVSVRATTGDQQFTAATAEDGVFQIDHVPATKGDAGVAPGYWVTVSNQGYLSTDQILGAEADGLIAVSAGQTTVVNATLQPMVADLNGTVLDTRGSPVKETAVRLLRTTDGTERTVITDALGSFKFQGLDCLPYPSYALLAGGPGYRMVAMTDQPMFQLQPGTADDHVLRLEPKTGTLAGRVTGVSGDMVTRGEVVAQGSESERRSAIGGDGSFQLDLPVGEGPYAIAVAGSDGWVGVQSDSSVSALDLIDVAPGRTVMLPLAVWGGHVILSGRVVDETGSPVANRQVVLLREGAGRVANQFTDIQGTVRFQVKDDGSGLRYALEVDGADSSAGGVDQQTGLPVVVTPSGHWGIEVELLVISSRAP